MNPVNLIAFCERIGVEILFAALGKKIETVSPTPFLRGHALILFYRLLATKTVHISRNRN